MTEKEMIELLKQPAVREAIKNLIVQLAAANAFAPHPGLNLPGVGRGK